MDAYWDAVWQIAGILAVLGVCVAVGGAIVIGVWLGVRRLVGDSASSAAVMGTASAAAAPRFSRSRAAAGRQASAARGAQAPAGSALPPPDAMGHTPKSALAERSNAAGSGR